MAQYVCKTLNKMQLPKKWHFGADTFLPSE